MSLSSKNPIKTWLSRDTRGAAMLEYAIIIALIAIIAIFGVYALGKQDRETFCRVASMLNIYVLDREALCDEEDTTPPPPPPPPPPPEPATIAATGGPACGEYKEGDEIFFTVTYDKIVNTDEAYITIDVGGKSRQANLASGSGTNTLTFSYTLVFEDEDSDGITFKDKVVHGEVLDADGLVATGDFSEQAADMSCATAFTPDVCTENCRYLGTQDGYIIKIGDKNRTVWKKRADTSYPVYDIAVGPDGYVYSASNSVKKWDDNGNVLWNSLGHQAMKIAVTKDNIVVTFSKHGYIYAFKEDGSRTHGYYPTVKAPYNLQENSTTKDYPTGLVVDDKGNAYATTYYGIFAKIDLDDMRIEWSDHWNHTSEAHIGGLAIAENGLVYTSHWRPNSTHRDGSQDEYILGWQDYDGSTAPAMADAINVWKAGNDAAGRPSHLASGPGNFLPVVVDNVNGFTSSRVRGYKYGLPDAYIWDSSRYGTVKKTFLDREGVWWVMAATTSSTYLTPYNVKDGKQTNSEGVTQSSAIFDKSVITFAMEPGVYGAGY